MRRSDQPEVSEQLLVAASPPRVWPLISDITFVVAGSPELQSVRWADGRADGPSVGRTFVGVNRNEHFGEWETTSTVTECNEPTVFAWTVGDVDEPNTTWRFTLEPTPDGTLVTQWVKLGPGPSGLTVAVERLPDKEERIVERRLADWRGWLRGNLQSIKDSVEGR